MADFITPVYDILTRLCGCCAKWVDSIRQLGDNLNSLKNDSDELNRRYLDVKMKVETTETNPDRELMILNEVRGWMGRVQVLQNEVEAILQKGDQEKQAKCFGGRCPKNCRTSYKLNKMVNQKLRDVNELMSKGYFDVVAEKFARDQFDELPMDKAVGVESTFAELCSCFEDNQVGIIGLYGMGGVGKTTLLKKFNNDFLSTIPHYVVIWVVASKDADPGKIQDDIRKKIRVEDDIWENKTVDERALLLCNILNKKKFVLLLDDVWERIDLLKLGFPSLDKHQSKIIFTTRLEGVCGQMGAKRSIRVNCLTPEQAFELFKEKVSETTLEDPRIFHYAKQVVDECQGLPLALCCVGRALANKVNHEDWEDAIENLSTRPSRVEGISKYVYPSLEFSYRKLPDPYKPCFLYCTLFPEDYNISKEDIILFWIAEGFLAEFDYDIYKARKEGKRIISYLKYACLLENGEEYNTIKMHDVIRDMALWIACDRDEKTKFFVRDCSTTSVLELYNHAKLKEVEKLSMCRGDGMITNLSQKPHCPNLVTLLVRDTEIQVFPTEVFVIPSTIRVLDLSDNFGIRDLPSEIGNFVNLERLNLSYTDIRKLPDELKNLKKLRFLLLNYLSELQFTKDVISSLLSLQALSMTGSLLKVIDDDNDALLQELEGLDHLQDIRITVRNKSSVEKILKSSKLQGRMCELFVDDCPLPHDMISSLAKMEHLETLSIGTLVFEGGVNIPRSSFWEHELTIMLRKLTLIGCRNIADLNWLIHAPHLEFLTLVGCYSLKEVISEDSGTDADTKRVTRNLFSSLIYLGLSFLSDLMSIYRMALKFPCLEKIEVLECPKLKKLPFNSQSALKNLRLFKGEPVWLNQLQWEDEATKHLFLSKFEPR